MLEPRLGVSLPGRERAPAASPLAVSAVLMTVFRKLDAIDRLVTGREASGQRRRCSTAPQQRRVLEAASSEGARM